MATLKNTEIDSAGFIGIPVGTTGNRPSNPETGMIRWNTDIDSFEEYNGTSWERYINSEEIENSVPQSSSVDQAVSFIGDGAIVESDSNSDGRYTRWSDGTQIVRHIDTSQNRTSSYPYTSGNATSTNSSGIWFGVFENYPKPFASLPTVINAQENSGSRSNSTGAELFAYTVHERGTSGAFLRFADFSGSSRPCIAMYIAIGRWT